jgi:hypothetical protein
MTILLLENFKLIVLFLLIGSIVGLSRIGGGKLTTIPSKKLRGSRQVAPVRS